MTTPLIGVVMGSSSDWDTMQHAVQILQRFDIAHEARVLSAHRMPDDMFAYADSAQRRGLRAIIAGAGGAAHLPGMLAAKTLVPVLGVPVPSRHLQGVDSLHSIVQMPKGVPVATFAIGAAGAANAALFALALLAADDAALRQRLQAFRDEQTAAARDMTVPPQGRSQGGTAPPGGSEPCAAGKREGAIAPPPGRSQAGTAPSVGSASCAAGEREGGVLPPRTA
jgi:5-(carboxyamino)imidazole ribonucleotide mutase